ncbi:helix-turn-helix transcriptional regulator [Saccharopolyspora sp. MS10]|uniref:helix-turn-helix transcriptional regulator n=1 Tax=Saccharopolyspora sp. MS10 TaxID=3385973 RepID=UPI0039A39447
MAADPKRRTELGAYLRARRAAVDPADVGLPRGRRRVSGLRREEVATLAGVSVDYYSRLEQGRERHPSPQLLSSLGRVLRLDEEERLHLHRLAGADPAQATAHVARSVSAPLRGLIDRWSQNPAFVYDDAQEILAANALGRALHSGFANPDNFARMVFRDPAGASFFVEWERVASDTVGFLRQAWGKSASRSRTEAVVDELLESSVDFRRMWRAHSVIGKSHRTKTLHHPEIGRVVLEYHSFTVPDAPGQHLLICDAPAGSESERRVRLLAGPADAELPRTEAEGSALRDGPGRSGERASST